MSETISQAYVQDTKSLAVFSAGGPNPQFLVDTPQFGVLVVGLEPGGRIPLHSGEPAMYHIIEGEGLMTVGDETYDLRPGATVIVPGGVRRGMNARTRVVFLAAKGEK